MCKCKVSNICEIALNCVNSTLECLHIYFLEYAAYLSLWWGGDLLLRAGDFLLRLSSRSRCSNLDICDERHAKCSTFVEFDSCASQFIFILLNSMPGVHAFTFRLLPYCYLCRIDLFQEHFPLLFTTENSKNAFQ